MPFDFTMRRSEENVCAEESEGVTELELSPIPFFVAIQTTERTVVLS
jgi:hypothetical protein